MIIALIIAVVVSVQKSFKINDKDVKKQKRKEAKQANKIRKLENREEIVETKIRLKNDRKNFVREIKNS